MGSRGHFIGKPDRVLRNCWSLAASQSLDGALYKTDRVDIRRLADYREHAFVAIQLLASFGYDGDHLSTLEGSPPWNDKCMSFQASL